MRVTLKSCASGIFTVAVVLAVVVVTLQTLGAAQAAPQTQGPLGVANGEPFTPSPGRMPVDLGLDDPAIVGAIDIHTHLNPDSPGANGLVRAIDVFDFAKVAKRRGMRGFAVKTHHDPMGAGTAYLVRTHQDPTMEVFGVMALNYGNGGINAAAVERFAQISGGWGRIVMMPSVDTYERTLNEKPEDLPRIRPWMLLMPPGTPKYVAITTTPGGGDLLPVVTHLIGVMSKIRTVDSYGPLVLATGHATQQEHLLLAREGRKVGLQVVITHGGSLPAAKQQELAKTGAFIEYTLGGLGRRGSNAFKETADTIRQVGPEHIIVSTDCGFMGALLPSDCLALAAKGLRSQGVAESDLNLMFKHNPAKLLSLPLLKEKQE